MQDLNDLYYFVQVVECGGFAAAGRALGMQKSKLSRRVNLLEERLGVRLLQRSSRSFSVTEIGQEYFRQCLIMLEGAEAAQAVIDVNRSEPQGVIKMTCPPGLIGYYFGRLVARFMVMHPRVQVYLKSFNRRVDVIAEGYDLSIRVGASLSDHGGLMQRKLGETPQCLVASPSFLDGEAKPLRPSDLGHLPTLAFGMGHGAYSWSLERAERPLAVVPLEPRLVSDDLSALRDAALEGVGIAQLPELLARPCLDAGTLVEVLPEWRPSAEIVCAVFPSRRGLLPSIRALLDFLAKDCEPYRNGAGHLVDGRDMSISPPARQ